MRRFSIHEKAEFLRDAVFAANDGIVTTFAIVAGAAGASLTSNVVLILGIVNLLADSFSMGAGNYLGVKSQLDFENSGKGDVRRRLALKQGLVTFISFSLAGLLPLIPYILDARAKFSLSIFIVCFSLFFIGSFKGSFSKKVWYKSGLEMFIVGGTAALVAYFAGLLLDIYIS